MIGTMLIRLERPAENIISMDSIFGMVPISSANMHDSVGQLSSMFICNRQHFPVKLL